MKRARRMAALIFLTAVLLCPVGCGPFPVPREAEGKILIVTTVFPLYDWAREVVGNEADIELVCLIENGSDYHSFQPSASDVVRIASADLIFYVGGPSEEWVEDAMKNRVRENQKSLCLFELLADRTLPEETVPGMQEEKHEEEEGTEYDEHLWLSVRNAEEAVKAFSRILEETDPARAKAYEARSSNYLDELKDLDAAYREAVLDGRRNTVLFADRFPFRYLSEDYGLRYYAAFKGCSSDTEASFATIIFLSEKLRELSLPAVLRLERSDSRLAEAVISASGLQGVEILAMDSMQAVSSAERQRGASYLGIMEQNLEILKRALN